MSYSTHFLRPVCACVNMDSVVFNLRQIRGLLSRTTSIMAIVKADAYGHGAVEVSRAVLEEGVSYLGVAFLDEAIELREAGIDAPILILGYTQPEYADKVIEYGVTQTVYTHELAESLSKSAARVGKPARVHVKVDTGMNRLGVPYRTACRFVEDVFHMRYLEVEGIFTHMSSADEKDKGYTEKQFKRFVNVLDELKKKGVYIPLKHVANSATIIDLPNMQMDMVRLGVALYGLWPSNEVDRSRISLREVMELKTEIVYVKSVPEGEFVSYGRAYRTTRPSRIATVPLGYADGFLRRLSNRAEVLVKGRRVPVVGRVCMDHFMIDVTDVPGVSIGDEVVVFGRQGEEFISIDEVASHLDTINYEVPCLVSKRVKRVYTRGLK